MSRQPGADRRQFGRRDSNMKAYALLPGQITLPCVIENVSDGGALLLFTDGAAPTQSFRLMIEGTEFNILCEIRHACRRSAGVRFIRLAEGIALNRHLLRAITRPREASDAFTCLARVRCGATAPSVRALRNALRGSWVLMTSLAETVPTARIDRSNRSRVGGVWSTMATAALAAAGRAVRHAQR